MSETYSLALSITDMVYTRLPFLEKTDTNKALIQSLTVEVMFDLDICFKTGILETEETEWSEDKYNVLQKSIIADIVCIYILLIQMLANIGGVASSNGSSGSPAPKFLKQAKAGSVEVQWEQFDLNKATLAMSGEKLLDRFKKSAINKALKMGCIIDICDDCSLIASKAIEDSVAPLKIVNFASDCGCGGSIPEQG